MKNILIVEDDAVLRDILIKKLSEAGFSVNSTSNGEEVISTLKNNPADLVLLDILLPGKSGLDILAEMKNDPNLSKIPVIAISNSGDVTEVEKIKSLGVQDFLVKAVFDSSDVLDRVNKILNEKSASSEEAQNIATNENKSDMETQNVPSGNTDGDNHATENNLGVAQPTPTPAPSSNEAPAESSASQAEAPASEDSGQKTVLIVEDDRFLREIAAQKLQRENFRVLGATNGKEAVDMLVKTKPDIMILDLILPGMDGFEVLANVRQNPELKNLPVIILSNLGQEEDIKKAKDLGATDYLIKAHFSFGEIIKKIREVLGMPQ